ncbi:toxin VasX [Kangiella shandongensis]|uniref:toxin VasX n=1 Tax=Kangiella shandongensis TaxID=2763258 RepID=UPI001CC11BDA|nr:toxin VasX [Kangiella shandongensis]
MPRENLSSTQAANDPVAPCDQSIIPIFPVRFAFKPDVLMEIANEYRNTSAEDNMHNEHDYCLRRIRQGFVYIFVPNCVEDKDSCSDSRKGYWLVFRYHTSAEDQNSCEIRTDTETQGSGQYTFQMYKWVDGNAAGKWELDSSRIYPYAFVPEATTQIEIGYSEFRWPAYFFEEAERNPAFRENILTSVDLSAEQTNFSAPMRDLDQHVEEFKPTLVDKISDYLISQTGIAPEDKKTVAFCEHSKTKGRIVALHDPMGRLLDINATTLVVNNTQSNFNMEYQYPLTTARAVDKIKSHLDENWNWFKDIWGDRPVSEETNRLREDFVDLSDNFFTMQENLVKLHSNTIGHQLAYSIKNQIRYAHNNGVKGNGSDSDLEIINYTTALLSQAVTDLNTSKVGSDYITKILSSPSAKAISQDYDENFNLWHKLSGVVKTGLDKGLAIAEKAFQRFDIMCTTMGLEMAQAMIVEGNVAIRESFSSMYRIEEWSTRPLTAQQIEDVIVNGQMPNETVITDSSQSSRYSRTTVYAGNRRLAPSNTAVAELDFMYIKFKDYEIRPAAGIRDQMPQFGYLETAANGLGAFLNAASIIDLLDKKDKAPADDDIFSKIGDNFWVNITVASISTIDDSYKTGQAFLRTSAGQAARSMVSSKLFSRINNNALFRAQSIALRASQSRSIAVASSVAKGLGRFAGIAGVLLSALQSASGFAQDKYAKGWGNALVAIGSGILLVFGATIVGAIIGAILIVLGILIEYFGALDPIQEWAKESFWGSSTYYWGENTERESIENQIEIAKALSDPHDPSHSKIKSELKKEMEAFDKLFNFLAVLPTKNRKVANFQVYLPYLAENDSLNDELKINISIEHNTDSSWFNDDLEDIAFAYDINYQKKIITVDYSSSLPTSPGYLKEVEVEIEYTPTGKETMEIEKTIYQHELPDRFLYRGFSPTIDDHKTYGWAI